MVVLVDDRHITETLLFTDFTLEFIEKRTALAPFFEGLGLLSGASNKN
jgi:hypothetical protein